MSRYNAPMKPSRRNQKRILTNAIELLEPRQMLHGLASLSWIAPPDGSAFFAPPEIAGHSGDDGDGGSDAPPIGQSTSAPSGLTPSAALPGLPTINTNPTAATAIYLDFNGDAGGATTYDVDGDPTSFNAAEAASITEAVRQIADYFAPFDVNVTTIKPSVPYVWGVIGNNIVGGYSYVGVFPNSAPESFNNSGDARTRQSGLAHEYGHNYGLSHQSDYSLLGVKTNEYSSGFDSTHGPIMGVDYAQYVHKWFIGHNSNSPNGLQDDLSIISGKIKAKEAVGGDGYRPDDFGGTIATATPLTVTGAIQSASGIIERMTDADAFSFAATTKRITLDVSPISPSAFAPKVEIYDSAGNLLAALDDTRQRNGTTVNNDETLAFQRAINHRA